MSNKILMILLFYRFLIVILNSNTEQFHLFHKFSFYVSFVIKLPSHARILLVKNSPIFKLIYN